MFEDEISFSREPAGHRVFITSYIGLYSFYIIFYVFQVGCSNYCMMLITIIQWPQEKSSHYKRKRNQNSIITTLLLSILIKVGGA